MTEQGGQCVAAAHTADGGRAIRDSKDPDGPVLLFASDAWRAFISAVKADELPSA